MSGTTLDLALGMVFYFFVVSLLCSTVLEWLQAVILSRGKFLKAALEKTLGVAKVQRLYQAPPIASLSPNGRLPSYVSKEAFASAVKACQPSDQASSWLPEVNSIVPRRSSASPAETWFEDFGDRASGWFKRRAQLLLLVIAIIVVTAGNLDAIVTYRSLQAQPQITALLVDKSVGLSTSLNAPAEKPEELAKKAAGLVKTLSNEAPFVSAPLWTPKGQEQWTDPWSKLLGLFLSVVAVLVGAPFWFDLLNRLVNFRQVGKKS